jgi:hypothetical protein
VITIWCASEIFIKNENLKKVFVKKNEKTQKSVVKKKKISFDHAIPVFRAHCAVCRIAARVKVHVKVCVCMCRSV